MAKVLLVEDDNNLREIFELRLKADGHTILSAGDGEAALVSAMKEKPDLIICDVMMPKMSGFEMLETLRGTPEMAKIKVIMMTALGQAEDQARGAKLGVIKYLVKSQVTLEDFARVVREVLGSAANEVSQANNNKVESEKTMDDTTTNTPPTNPMMPTPPADGGSGDGPADSPAPAAFGADQQTTAAEQSTVNSQVSDFAAAPPASDSSTPPMGGDASSVPPVVPPAGSTTEHDDVPVATPPPADPTATPGPVSMPPTDPPAAV